MEELATYLRFAAALAAVIGLILALGWLARRRGWSGLPGMADGRRRLAVVETLALDARHRLVLVRRDRVEHLLLLGPAGATLVERGSGVTVPETQA